MPYTFYQAMSNTSSKVRTPVHTTISAVDCRDGGTLIVIDQPNSNRSDLSEDDRIALDDAAQERLYKFLHTKFGGA